MVTPSSPPNLYLPIVRSPLQRCAAMTTCGHHFLTAASSEPKAQAWAEMGRRFGKAASADRSFPPCHLRVAHRRAHDSRRIAPGLSRRQHPGRLHFLYCAERPFAQHTATASDETPAAHESTGERHPATSTRPYLRAFGHGTHSTPRRIHRAAPTARARTMPSPKPRINRPANLGANPQGHNPRRASEASRAASRPGWSPYEWCRRSNDSPKQGAPYRRPHRSTPPFPF